MSQDFGGVPGACIAILLVPQKVRHGSARRGGGRGQQLLHPPQPLNHNPTPTLPLPPTHTRLPWCPVCVHCNISPARPSERAHAVCKEGAGEGKEEEEEEERVFLEQPGRSSAVSLPCCPAMVATVTPGTSHADVTSVATVVMVRGRGWLGMAEPHRLGNECQTPVNHPQPHHILITKTLPAGPTSMDEMTPLPTHTPTHSPPTHIHHHPYHTHLHATYLHAQTRCKSMHKRTHTRSAATTTSSLHFHI